MEYKTDIAIAQNTVLDHIRDIASKLKIKEDDLELYGKYKAKLPLSLIDEDEMKEEFAGHYKKIMADPGLRQIYLRGENEADRAADTPQPVKISDLSRIH